MMCVNCQQPAVWSHRVTGAEPVFFCNTCLPQTFRLSAIKGNGSIGPETTFDPSTAVAPEPPTIEPVLLEPVEPTEVMTEDEGVAEAATEEWVDPTLEDAPAEVAPKTSKKK